jgi:hypothetical protein
MIRFDLASDLESSLYYIKVRRIVATALCDAWDSCEDTAADGG